MSWNYDALIESVKEAPKEAIAALHHLLIAENVRMYGTPDYEVGHQAEIRLIREVINPRGLYRVSAT